MSFDNIITFINRCDLPKFDCSRTAEAYIDSKAKSCPFCGKKISVIIKNVCAGHGEFYETMYIRCNLCRLEKMIYYPLGGDFYDGLVKNVELWNERVKHE